jgi:predicted dehydrogenase/NADPH:quinone reductase-like Zn-dependent oxidoreductase
MRQILQSLRTGETRVADVPAPSVQKKHVLIRTSRTLVSAGTERMLVEFGHAGWIDKARQQPDKVRQVLNKIGTDGLVPTIEAVLNKLDQPLPLGYSNVGVAVETGTGVSGIAVGERVASNGRHADLVSVPMNLCAKVPDAVTDDEAAFTVVAAISLQGVRLAQPSLGEYVAVTGLGLIGLITVQLLRAHGCQVLGIDFDPAKLALASGFGAQVVDLSVGEDPVAAAAVFSRGRGVDAVLITASTASSEPVHQAALMSRKRGRIVLIGVAGLELSRADFYEKELTFQVSCSYGPGRYDPTYEEQGVDYPLGFVRWTEQRNFEAVLDMMSDRRLDVRPLISHRFPITEADRAYEVVTGSATSLGILLEYPTASEQTEAATRHRTVQLRSSESVEKNLATVGFIGAGNYATAVLIPAFKAAGARLRAVASSGGVSGLHAAKKFGFELTTTDTSAILADPTITAVAIATRHDTHAGLVRDALSAGKHVFVEKPLAIKLEDVDQLEQTLMRESAGASRILMVGFNRRFAPHVRKIRDLLGRTREPKAFVMTVNAGSLPPTHWAIVTDTGGGRIAGEACHFIDLLRFLADAPISGFSVTSMAGATGVVPADDKAVITLRFADGSIGTIQYLANGHRSFPKERLEVFVGGRILQLNNFRSLVGFGWPGFHRMNLWRQDKGQRACAAAFVAAVNENGPSPIPLEELFEVSRITLQIAAAAANGSA